MKKRTDDLWFKNHLICIESLLKLGNRNGAIRNLREIHEDGFSYGYNTAQLEKSSCRANKKPK